FRVEVSSADLAEVALPHGADPEG
ncbi:MAG: hypothetical protein RLZZ199_987, partial [Actinomycetota bacterium]